MIRKKICRRGIACILTSVVLTGCHHNGDGVPSDRSKKTTAIESLANLAPVIHVQGNKLVDGESKVIQLRGVNLMGMEYTAIGGWWPKDPFFTVVENTWPALHAWHVNSIRIPLNETSYLGIQCVSAFTGPAYKKPGRVQDPDPGHNYRQRLKEVVDRATREGLYIIVDLHMSAPNDLLNEVGGVTTQCAADANPLPDLDHARDFWIDLASSYKGYPNVLFELFNNPHLDQWKYFSGSKLDAWHALRDGTTVNSYLPLWPTKSKHEWKSIGTQQLVDAVRNTGATNIILIDGMSKSADLEHWVEFAPVDPLHQIAASWHAFAPKDSKPSEGCYVHPAPWCSDRSYEIAKSILDSQYPVIVSEFGDSNIPGATTAPFAASLLDHLDSLGISYLGWTFTAGTMTSNQLIKDNNGTPTDGYGQLVFHHYGCRAEEQKKCATTSSGQSSILELRNEPNQPSRASGVDPSASPL